MEVPSPIGVVAAGLTPEPQLREIPAVVCHLQHSSQQCQILNPLIEARDQTHVLMDASRVRSQLSHDKNFFFFLVLFFQEICSFLLMDKFIVMNLLIFSRVMSPLLHW